MVAPSLKHRIDILFDSTFPNGGKNDASLSLAEKMQTNRIGLGVHRKLMNYSLDLFVQATAKVKRGFPKFI